VSRKVVLIAIVLVAACAAGYAALRPGAADLVLTGVVTTNDVVVSPLVTGQVSRLFVAEGDSVTANQLIALLAPAELRADQAYYTRSADAVAAQVSASEASLAVAIAQDSEAVANLANARRILTRDSSMAAVGGVTPQDLDQARTDFIVAQTRADAGARQVAAARSAVASSHEQQGAADAQAAAAGVRLGYTEIRAPIAGIVDVRVARVGEVIAAGQPIVTLIDPNDLWVRADVEESYIDQIRVGDSLTVVLPSGVRRRGVVYYRSLDAGFATQRDVSRTKRDIKTFEIRLRVDNHDRRLAIGMTAHVLLPLAAAKS